MRRFFAPTDGKTVTITGEDAHHIANVLRLKSGDTVAVCDGSGNDYITEITAVSKTEVFGNVIEKKPSLGEMKTRVTLYQGLPKGDKFEYIIQKAVELGIYRIVPCSTEFCVAKIEPKKVTAKLERWNKIALSAAKQCGRGIIPRVDAPLDFNAAASAFSAHELSVLAYEEEHTQTLKQVLQQKHFCDMGVFIGSEGGISCAEAKKLLSLGAFSVTLGSRILRTETASVALLSMILYEYE